MNILSQDITYLKRVEAQLEYAAFHDSLTGLPNRVQLLENIEKGTRFTIVLEHGI